MERGGADLNRNFQHEHPYYEADAGRHMVSEPESRGLMDFMIANRHIGAVLTFGHSDNLVTAPNGQGQLADASTIDLVAFAAEANAEIYTNGVFGGRGGGCGQRVGARGAPLRGTQPGADNDPQSGRRPEVTVNEGDLEYFSTVSEAYEEITGITEIGVNRRAEGAFLQVAYYQFGIPSFSTQGWGLPAMELEEEESDDQAADDAGAPGGSQSPRDGAGIDTKLIGALGGAGSGAFVEWSPYEHPEFGAVDIGGFRPYVTTNPPAEQLPELGRKHGEFVVRIAGMLPRVNIVNTEVEDHGGGVFTVTAEIENSDYLPTSLQHGVVSRSVQPTTVRIQVGPQAILTGDPKSSTVQRLEGSGSRATFSWVIQSERGQSIEIWVRSQKGGTDTATVTLEGTDG